MRKLILALMSLVLLFAGTAWPLGLKSIGPEDARFLIEENSGNPGFVILDMRTPGEFKRGHIPSAVPVDFYSGDFKKRLGKLDKATTYLIYCRSGRRTGIALGIMKSLGFESVYNLSRGINGWAKKGYSITR